MSTNADPNVGDDYSQIQSPLYSVIPPEIRSIIYDHVIVFNEED